MLSDNAIENLIQPIILRQEAINRRILLMIVQRIREIGALTPSDVRTLVQALKMGGDAQRINKEIANLTGLQVNDVKRLIREVAISAYADARPFYDYRMKSFIPYEENEPLQRIVNAVGITTTNTFSNISNTRATGFLIRDLKNPKRMKWHTIGQTYETVIDEAAQAVQSGVVDFNTAMRRTVNQLIQSGVRRVDYQPESGRRYTKRLDSAVRQNLLDAVRAINQAVDDEVGRQIGADGKEITVHAMPAPDHEDLQGQQFTNEEYAVLQSQDESKIAITYTGRKIAVPHRCVGIWNCRHIARSVILGVMKPNYTQKELDQIKRDNKKGVTIGGKHYTMYEATQKQRDLETLVRYAKDGQIVAKELDDYDLIAKYQDKVQRYMNDYREFSKQANLKIALNRTQVDGYIEMRL